MKTENVTKIANEAKNHLQYYKILYLVHKKVIKLLLIGFSAIIICLIEFHVCFSCKTLINLLIELFL